MLLVLRVLFKNKNKNEKLLSKKEKKKMQSC